MPTPPVDQIVHAINNVFGLDKLLQNNDQIELEAEDIKLILEEAGKFASERLESLNRSGDQEGTSLEDGVVTTAKGWKELYRDWAEAGWNGISGPVEYGGQGMPQSMLIATYELWDLANQSFAIGPLLTASAIKALNKYGSDELKATYLEKLVSGEWMGTMLLTEAHAGSDLGQLRTKAVRQEDGTFKLSGTKIFITYGDHELTENIIHMVLARIEGAPEGTRGISLFLVPKFILNQDSTPGERNDIYATGLENKMGLHASPTCTLTMGDHGGATGYLVGIENEGLKAMFTMMNSARLGVGVQGLGIAEAAYQQAAAYAEERKQGKAQSKNGQAGMVPILHHHDIQRMLLDMKTKTEAVRLICYRCAVALDTAQLTENQIAQEEADIAALLIPVAKAFSTDIGCENAHANVQVHGGMGYIEETGAAQIYRDARILPIYEGTNGIQAIDLVMRKLPMGDGNIMTLFVSELKDIADNLRLANSDNDNIPFDPVDLATYLDQAITDFEETSQWLIKQNNPGNALAGASSFLRMMGLTAGAAYLVKSALAHHNIKNDPDTIRSAFLMSAYFIKRLLPEAASLKNVILAGSEDMDLLAKELYSDALNNSE